MANEIIFYRAADCNMGDETEQDCKNYRAWAKAEIEAAYPDAALIEVINQDRGSTVYAENDEEECKILVFLCELWDRCPWYGEFFEKKQEEKKEKMNITCVFSKKDEYTPIERECAELVKRTVRMVNDGLLTGKEGAMRIWGAREILMADDLCSPIWIDMMQIENELIK